MKPVDLLARSIAIVPEGANSTNGAAWRTTRSTCPYCGVGCGVLIESEGGHITGVRGDREHPANFGKLCTKGGALHLSTKPELLLQLRALQPELRTSRGVARQTVSWDIALDHAAQRFAALIHQHGPDSVGFYISGQLLTEDYYVFNKLAKGLIGTNNVDTNSRVCMSSAVAGYKATLGADAPPCAYEDIDHAACLFFAGSNAAWSHPIAFRRIEKAKAARPEMRIVVVDPRRTETAELADLHLQLLPGTDVALFHAMLHVMVWEDLVDPDYIAAHTSGYPALRDLVRDMSPAVAANLCGLKAEDIVTAARWFALGAPGATPQTRQPTLSLYCQGLNQSSSGTAKNAGLINLHLACGQIGKPGAGPFSLTGQPNAMGGREVGGMANLLSAHRDLANPAHRAEVAALWGVAEVPAARGKTAIELFQAAADGEVKALWIACTNPAQSLPDQALVRRALERAEFVVVQEAYTTAATVPYADLLLPATTWGEKEGTVTNSERRISRVRRAVPAPGAARDDWAIATDFARRLEALIPERLNGNLTLFPYSTPEEVWNEHRESTRGRDLDITGLSWAVLERDGPQQWPYPEGATAGKTRLYEDGIFPTADGRARFFAQPFKPVAEPCDARYPLALTTGRLRDQWHGMTRTGSVPRLFSHAPQPCIDLHPAELARRGLRDGELLRVASRRGDLLLPARATDTVRPGQAFIAMHWGAEYLGGRNAEGVARLGVNGLTLPALDPQSFQPELKHSAVRVEAANLPWHLAAFAWLPEDRAMALRATLMRELAELPFVMCVPFGRERTGLLLRAAARGAPDAALLARIEAHFGVQGSAALHYADPGRGVRRAVRLDGEALAAALLCGPADSVVAQGWLHELLQSEASAKPYGRWLLLPSTTPPAQLPSRGQQVCNCFDVWQSQIDAVLPTLQGDDDSRLSALQAQLKCGTNCGSCLPELRRRLRATATAAEA
ncbi:nitrate reductase [Thiomonas sp.]|uniref:nitrate reductase n=1 Tax=Thiomonas sp. TaxID=2047785 RepID=UPI00262DEEAB|nr:nitrate reductase [Thiomonas sp.]